MPSNELHLTKNATEFTASTLHIEIECDSGANLQEQKGILTQTELPLSSQFSPGFFNVQLKNGKICKINNKLTLFLKGEFFIFLQN